ncbi:hypothetical protein K3G39_19335 [Pontibacter sp. HSC-14F20]|uniref:MauE/DoxX family redox-associated membrane protein n=1 Tax=Pontibacter sp. HSC-14F20 TaxID=2864136 RepID=UPI001C73C019|nr:MauE/DoxX family redox-associated membrane protein [Pontibacter sp. HSC-14F20]MBX0335394.1 hypothetical protein [Pontibacter sp. HSC-14F20]
MLNALPTFTTYQDSTIKLSILDNTMKRESKIQAIVAMLVLLFGYAALSKLKDWDESLQQWALQPVAREAVTWFAWGIPAMELLCCLLLVFDRTQRYGLYLALALMVLFTGYVGLALLGAWEQVPCSCGGVISGLGWGEHLLFNLFFTALTGAGLYLEKKQKRRRGVGRTSSTGEAAYPSGGR